MRLQSTISEDLPNIGKYLPNGPLGQNEAPGILRYVTALSTFYSQAIASLGNEKLTTGFDIKFLIHDQDLLEYCLYVGPSLIEAIQWPLNARNMRESTWYCKNLKTPS